MELDLTYMTPTTLVAMANDLSAIIDLPTPTITTNANDQADMRTQFDMIVEHVKCSEGTDYMQQYVNCPHHY